MHRHPSILPLTRPLLPPCRAAGECLCPPPPLLAAPPPRRRSPPSKPPVRLAATPFSPCARPLPGSGPASPRRLTPLSAGAAAHAVSARTARTCAPWLRPAVGQGPWSALTRAGGPLANGPTCQHLRVWDPGAPSDLARVFLGFIFLQSCKIHRNSCIAPKIVKIILLDSSSLELLKKNIVLYVTLL